MEESLLAVTPAIAPEVYEISDISSSLMADTEEDIRISDIEEKLFNSMQTFSSVPPLNSVQNLPVTASENQKEN